MSSGPTLRALGLLETLEQRIEIFARACADSGIGVPGGSLEVFHHPATPKSQQFVAYVRRACARDAKVQRDVQVAINRFVVVARAVGWRTTEQGRAPVEPILFQRQVFSLANVGTEFRHDPVLAQLFPGTQPLRRNAAEKLHQAQQAKEEETRRSVLLRAEELVAVLEPKLAVVRLALLEMERGFLSSLGDRLRGGGAEAVQVRKLAAALRDRPDAAAALREGITRLDNLKAYLARAVSIDLDAVREARLSTRPPGRDFSRPGGLAELFGE